VAALVAVAWLPTAPAAAATVPSVGGVSPRLGTTSGGTRVTVTGSGFGGVTSVKFATTAGRYVKVLSSSKLQVTTPPHAAGLVNVRVTTKIGTSAIRTADQFRFVGKPTIAKISPASGPSKGGTRLTITGTGFYSVTAVTIAGKAGIGRTVVSPTSLRVTTPDSTSGPASVVVKTAFGTSTGKTFTYVPSWHNAQLIDRAMGGFRYVSCAGRICVAVDQHDNVLIYSGSGWSEPKKLVSNGYITALSCGSPTMCVIGDSAGYVLVWDGFGWSPPRNVTADYGGYVSALSCSSASSCVAIDGSGYYSVLTGTTWSTPEMVQSDTYLNVTSLSCTSATFCMALVTIWSEVGGANSTDAYEFHGVNTGWLLTEHLTNGWTLSDLSCSTMANEEPFCVAVDPTHFYMTWPVAGWWSPPAEITLSEPNAWVTGVACRRLENCWVADSSGMAYAWNGAAWGTGTSVVASYPYDIACSSTGLCALVDADNQAALYLPGTGWTTPTRLVITHGGIQSISCPTKDFCVAVDVGGYAFRWNGVRWTDPINLVAPAGMLSSVSCVSPTFCVASSWNGQAVVFDGTSWVTTQLSEGLRKVSCATSGACVAVGWHSVFVWNGSTWSDAVPVITDDLAPGFKDVSCVHSLISDACLAVDAAGQTYRASFPAPSWSADVDQVPVAGGDEVSGLSCSPDGLCTAITAQGFAWMNSGGGWGNAAQLSDPYSLQTVSCAPGNYCAVTAWSGLVYTTSIGGVWSNVQVSQDNTALLSVSCESSAFCMAGDNEGRVYRFA
jgi:hypothetical protein